MMKRLWLDSETTGTDPRRHAVTQIAMLVEIDGKVVREWECKLRPWEGAEIEQEALTVTGKTLEEIMAYPEHKAGYAEFISVLGSYVSRFDRSDKFFLHGYNVTFDADFLHSLADKCGDPYLMSYMVWPGICVAQQIAAKRPDFWIGLRKRKLGIIAEAMGVHVEGMLHDALTDIRLTRAIWEKLHAA